MHIAIVGGGISGMYISWLLLQKGYKVSLFEQGSQLGGRIQTIYREDGISYETGASRFNKSHKLLINLLRTLDLHDKMVPIRGVKTYIKDGKEAKIEHWTDIQEIKKRYTDDYLKSVTLEEFLQHIYGSKRTQNIISSFGYNSEFQIQNAYTSLRIFEKDFNSNIQYYVLQGGLSQIITLIHKRLIEGGCNINLNTQVKDYNPQTKTLSWLNAGSGFGSSDLYDKVVFCITKLTLSKLPSLIANDRLVMKYIEGIQPAPLHRIFARFPLDTGSGKPWFSELGRTTSNNNIRYIIPIDPDKGVIMISYTDNQYADFWKKMPKKQLRNELLSSIRSMFPNKHIPQPLWIDSRYWKEGATYWRPGSQPYRNRKGSNFYIAGEMNSRFHTAWIEGALETAKKVSLYF